MKTFNQFQEAAGDKFSKMSDAQFKDWQRANPGAAEKAQKLRDAARSATPKPVGSGPQLPSVPKPAAREVTRADVRGNTRAAQSAASGTSGYRPGVGVTRDFKLDPNFKPQSSVRSMPQKPGFGTRVLNTVVKGARVAGAVGSALLGLDRFK